VFITPQGFNNGLYVAQKSASGFIVREHNGVSHVAFDIHIVAQPLGSQGQRSPAGSEPRPSVPEAIGGFEVNLRLRQSLAFLDVTRYFGR
jgi:hypothetical protein